MSAQPTAAWQPQPPPVASFRAGQARTLKGNYQQVAHALNLILRRLQVPDKAVRGIVGLHGMMNGRDKFPIFCAHKWAARQLNFKGQDENADQFMGRTIAAIRDAERACGRRFFTITPGGTPEQLMTSYDADHIGDAAVWLHLRAKYGADEQRPDCADTWKKHPAAAFTDVLIDEAIARLPECPPLPPKVKTDGPSYTDAWVIKGRWTKLYTTAEEILVAELVSGADPELAANAVADKIRSIGKDVKTKYTRERLSALSAQGDEVAEEQPAVADGAWLNTYPTDSGCDFIPADPAPQPAQPAAAPEIVAPTPRQADGGVAPEVQQNQPLFATKRAAALAYAATGWRVIPNHNLDPQGRCTCRKATCKTPGKHPRILKWEITASKDPAQVAKWWDIWPEANVGILAGADSGIVVLDVDPRNEGDISITTWIEEHGMWDETLEANTGGGGKHIVFQHPGVAFKNSASVLGAGLDIKTDGGQFIVEPSTHASGGTYKWAQFRAPGPMPEAMIAELMKQRSRKPATGQADGPLVITSDGPPILDGTRNRKLFEIASALRGKGATEEQLAEAMHAINKARCMDKFGRETFPVDDEEIATIVESVMKYEPNAATENAA
jgi:putative DNA primase/helicase